MRNCLMEVLQLIYLENWCSISFLKNKEFLSLMEIWNSEWTANHSNNTQTVIFPKKMPIKRYELKMSHAKSFFY